MVVSKSTQCYATNVLLMQLSCLRHWLLHKIWVAWVTTVQCLYRRLLASQTKLRTNLPLINQASVP